MEKLFGKELRKVAQTGDRADDVELAKQLVSVAAKSDRQESLCVMLCNKAFDMTHRIGIGHAAAVEAMEVLADKAPDQMTGCLERIVTVRQRQYALLRGDERAEVGEEFIDACMALAELRAEAGKYADAVLMVRRALAIATEAKSYLKVEIQQELTRLIARERVERTIARAKARLQADGDDATARTALILACVVGLDDPAAAATHLSVDVDETLRTYIPLAAKPVAGLAEAVCVELAEWYRGHAAKETAPAKTAMLQRARSYYVQYLDLHTGEDAARAKSQVVLKVIDAELAKLTEDGSAGRWVDLLKLVDPAKHRVQGRWSRQGGGIRIERTLALRIDPAARLMVPCVADGSYELQFTLARASGSGSTGVILPLGSTSVRLALGGWNGNTSGLELLDGKHPGEDNATRTNSIDLSDGRDVAVTVRVHLGAKDVEIVVSTDGKERIRWKGATSRLSSASRWKIPDARAFGLTATDSTVDFRTMRLRIIAGQARPLKGKDASGGAPQRRPRWWRRGG